MTDKTAKIKRLLKAAIYEKNKYKKTRRLVWLYQAAEKVWVAYVLLIEAISGKELKSHRAINNVSWWLIRKRKIKKRLYEDADILHEYHYEGRLNSKTVVEKIEFVINEIKRKVIKWNAPSEV